MIEKLKKKDIWKAAIVYNKGLSMEIPQGKSTFQNTIDGLSEEECFVYKEKGKIKGLVTFKKRSNNLTIEFICTIALRRGIGKKLIVHLARIALRRKIRFILSTVSTKDRRVMAFYNYCGFKKYSQYKSGRNFLLNRIKASPKEILSSTS